MPSPFSTDRSELCQHVAYRIGCLSCRAFATRGELQEAIVEKEKREALMKGYQATLEQSDVQGTERERFMGKLEKAKKQHAAWDERCQGLNEAIASIDTAVKDVCAENDPNALSEAFEKHAIEREEELRQIWRNAAPESEAELFPFVPEDPNCELSSKSLDRSNIPATPDTLISDDAGSQLFLEAGKNSQRLPKDAVDKDTGPAIMSYSRALENFGVPDGPGSEPTAEPSGEDRLKRSIAEVPAAAGMQDQRDQRRARILAKLEAWKAPEGFDDGTSNYPDPRQFYNGPAIGLLDMEKLDMEDREH